MESCMKIREYVKVKEKYSFSLLELQRFDQMIIDDKCTNTPWLNEDSDTGCISPCLEHLEEVLNWGKEIWTRVLQ